MPKISQLKASEILDSRGIPTVEVECILDSGSYGSFKVPSGASTGENEAIELRDGDLNRYLGKGVLKAVANVNHTISKALLGIEFSDYHTLDQIMIKLDGTPNKSNLGANAILGCSVAIFKALANHHKIPYYKFLKSQKKYALPVPMMNVINGGLHADNSLDFQEFMIRPIGTTSFHEALRMGSEVFQHLKKNLKNHHYSTNVGDEGGFAPDFPCFETALDYLIMSIESAKLKPGKDITIAIDCAASSFFDKKTHKYYELKEKLAGKEYKSFTTKEQISRLEKISTTYPIDSIEDGLDENDWSGFQLLTEKLGSKIQIVGDDIFVTNPTFLKKGIETKSANAILIKLNQIGTLSETIETIELAQKNNFKTIISHRSGETEDSFIADLAVGLNAGQIKTGSLSRSERICKYNRLLKIEREL